MTTPKSMLYLSSILFIPFLLFSAFAVAEEEIDANKHQVRVAIESAWNQGRTDDLVNWYQPSVAAEVVKQIDTWRTALPDLHISIQEQIAQDDKVATYWLLTGTHSGRLFDIEGTGKALELDGMTVNRFADGLIVQDWNSLDSLALMAEYASGAIQENLTALASTNESVASRSLLAIPSVTAMDEAAFTQLIKTLKALTYRRDKLALLKKEAKKNYFSIDQFITLLEDTKLHSTIAKRRAFKLLYPRLINTDNVDLVFEKVRFFSSDIRKLHKWMQEQQSE